MIPYASAMGEGRNRRTLRTAGWRLILNPVDPRDPGEFRYGIDNGAWPASEAFKAGKRSTPLLDEAAFLRTVDRYGSGADWIVAPDIVAGGLGSLDLSERWFDLLASREDLAGVPILIAVQDGMETPEAIARIRALLDRGGGLFVGGTTEFKETTLPVWGHLRSEFDCWLHVGRVNTTRRIALCGAAGATSFDGSSGARFSKNVPKLTGAARQLSLIGTLPADRRSAA